MGRIHLRDRNSNIFSQHTEFINFLIVKDINKITLIHRKYFKLKLV